MLGLKLIHVSKSGPGWYCEQRTWGIPVLYIEKLLSNTEMKFWELIDIGACEHFMRCSATVMWKWLTWDFHFMFQMSLSFPIFWITLNSIPNSKVHGTNMGPIWGRQDRFDFQKLDQHAGGKWLIHDTKRRKDNQLQSLKLPCRISKLSS